MYLATLNRITGSDIGTSDSVATLVFSGSKNESAITTTSKSISVVVTCNENHVPSILNFAGVVNNSGDLVR